MPSVKPIVTVPNTLLRTPSTPIVLDTKTQQFIASLAETLLRKDHPKGVGLSAPQIGKTWQVFATLLGKNTEDDAKPEDLRIYVNPIMTDHASEVTMGENPDDPVLEGCLSIPGLYGPVPRYTWIEMQYFEPVNGELVARQGRFESFLGRVIQHEYDHLQGVLFSDYSLKFDLPVYRFRGEKAYEIDKTILKAY